MVSDNWQMTTFNLKRFLFPYCKSHIMALFFGCVLLLSTQVFALGSDVYRLNPGDKMEITVWQEESLKQEVVVLPDGTISFPLVGHVAAAGKTTGELVKLLQERLNKFIPDSEINIRLLAAEGNLIYVTGEVKNPGKFEIKGPTDIMQALSMAGGLTAFAKKNNLSAQQEDDILTLCKTSYIQGSDSNFAILMPELKELQDKLKKVKEIAK